jgi:hypothetical protein
LPLNTVTNGSIRSISAGGMPWTSHSSLTWVGIDDVLRRGFRAPGDDAVGIAADIERRGAEAGQQSDQKLFGRRVEIDPRCLGLKDDGQLRRTDAGGELADGGALFVRLSEQLKGSELDTRRDQRIGDGGVAARGHRDRRIGHIDRVDRNQRGERSQDP